MSRPHHPHDNDLEGSLAQKTLVEVPAFDAKGPDGMPDPHREWELKGKLHRSREDAYAQVYKARVGSMVAATNTYLKALRVFVLQWLVEIEDELRKRGEL